MYGAVISHSTSEVSVLAATATPAAAKQRRIAFAVMVDRAKSRRAGPSAVADTLVILTCLAAEAARVLCACG
jgi:hypothetical protein